MRAAALFVVLATAKVAALGGHRIEWSPWTPVAYLWQDAAMALLFAIVEIVAARRTQALWIAYASACAYVALTMPVIRVLGTPLTLTMWRAAGGALSDSIVYYANMPNLIAIGVLGSIAAAAPLWTRRFSARAVSLCLLPVAILGPFSVRHVDLRGFDRNAWSALLCSALPRISVEARATEAVEWRTPLAGTQPSVDLSRLRGAAMGRNVVVVSLESTAAQYLGIYGASPDVAPNLSRLARSSVVFDAAYAVYPESIKGLFATLCSQYPAFDRRADSYANVPCRSPAAVLAGAGYRTALFHAGRFAYLGMNAVIRGRGFQRLEDAGDIGGNRESSFGVDEQAVVARMLHWVDGLQHGEHFFITYLPIAGHHPYESSTPGPFPDRTEFDRYRNAVHDGDAALGTFMQGLHDRGLDTQVMWLIYGDHGEAFGQHEGNFGHPFQLYEENVRVPFLVSMPGVLTDVIRSQRIVSLVDVAPTLLDATGADVPDTYRGTSAFDGRPRMALFFADYSLGLLGLRDGSNKLVYELESGRARLFDVSRDPLETRDLAGDRPDAARAYARHLTRWIRSGAGG